MKPKENCSKLTLITWTKIIIKLWESEVELNKLTNDKRCTEREGRYATVEEC